MNRRTLLARMGAAGMGAAAAALLAGGSGPNSPKGGSRTGLNSFADPANLPGIPGQNENLVVLNFALTLETLEADLFRQALNVAAGRDVSNPPAGSASDPTIVAIPGTGTRKFSTSPWPLRLSRPSATARPSPA